MSIAPLARRFILTGALSCAVTGFSLAAPSALAAQTDSSDAAVNLQALQKELAQRPDWTEGWWKLGTAAYELNRFDIAVPALQHVVTASPKMGLAWNVLGLSQFELGQYGPAEKSLDRAAALANSGDPEVDRVAAYHRGLLLIHNGKFADAENLLRSTFAGQSNAQAEMALGLAELHLALLPKEVNPARESLLIEIGKASFRGKDGLDDLAALSREHPDLPLLRLAYARALDSAGRTQEAQAQRRAAGPAAGREAAETSGREYFALTSTTPPADPREGMRDYAQGDYKTAAQKLATWVAAHPDDGTSWAVLGLSEFALHDYDNARLHLDRGVSLGMQADAHATAQAHFTLGVLLLKGGQFDRASSELRTARQLEGPSDNLDAALGYVLLRRQQLPSDAPDPLALQAGKIQAMLLESRYQEALPAFRELIASSPRTPFLHYAYGNALLALSEFDEASTEMLAERKISPNSALPEEGLATIALRQDRPLDAVETARRALALSPSTAEPHYLLGRAYLESDSDISAAVKELKQAAQLNPNSPEVHFSLAKAYARASDPKQAAAERAIFVQLSEASEAQGKSAQPETYSGPHNSNILSGVEAPPH